MGLFDALLGNVSEVKDFDKLTEQIEPIFVDGEKITAAFQMVRDQIVFTNKRMIQIDKQGLTGSKTSYRCIPYKSIESFSIETAGLMDSDSELILYCRGTGALKIEISKKVDIREVCKIISSHVL